MINLRITLAFLVSVLLAVTTSNALDPEGETTKKEPGLCVLSAKEKDGILASIQADLIPPAPPPSTPEPGAKPKPLPPDPVGNLDPEPEFPVNTDWINDSSDLASRGVYSGFIQKAPKYFSNLQAAMVEDVKTLSSPYKGYDIAEIKRRLRLAEEEMKLASGIAQMDGRYQEQFKSAYEKTKSLNQSENFERDWRNFVETSAVTPELRDQMIFYYGISPSDWAGVDARLRSLELFLIAAIKEKNSRPLLVPKNSRAISSCSQAVATLVTQNPEVSLLRAGEFQQIWVYLTLGVFVPTENQSKERSRFVKRLSTSFHAINPYRSGEIRAGDFVLFSDAPSNGQQKSNPVYLVRSFDPARNTLQAVYGSADLGFAEVPISIASIESKKRMRDGIYVLRPKQTFLSGCLEDASRSTAFLPIENRLER